MINTPRLRCMIGWLGIALPWIVIPLVGRVPTSISATWYSAQAITPFMIILGAAAFLLISYKGYNWIDDLVNTVAGLAALVICLCPCGGSEFWDLPMKQLVLLDWIYTQVERFIIARHLYFLHYCR